MEFLGDSQYAYLPSNTNQSDLYPDNRPDQYTVKLARAIQIEAGSRWKVGVVGLTLPTYWQVIHEENNSFKARKLGTIVYDTISKTPGHSVPMEFTIAQTPSPPPPPPTPPPQPPT